MDTKEQLIKDFKEVVGEAQEELFDKLVADRMPYLESDAEMNVSIYAERVVKKLIQGNFKVNGDFLQVDQDGFSMHIPVTSMEWDAFRESLIKLMPSCPKDKKIEMLERQIKELYERFH